MQDKIDTMIAYVFFMIYILYVPAAMLFFAASVIAYALS